MTLRHVKYKGQTIQFDIRDYTDEVLWTTIVKADKDYRDALCMIILVGERKMCNRQS